MVAKQMEERGNDIANDVVSHPRLHAQLDYPIEHVRTSGNLFETNFVVVSTAL
jgi:hypothetical protein